MNNHTADIWRRLDELAETQREILHSLEVLSELQQEMAALRRRVDALEGSSPKPAWGPGRTGTRPGGGKRRRFCSEGPRR